MQTLRLCNQRTKRYELANCSYSPSPYNAGNGNSRKFRQNLPRNNCCTNANYILEGSCANGEAKNANPPFVQSAHKAVRARKLFLLHHRRIMSAMEIRANSYHGTIAALLQTTYEKEAVGMGRPKMQTLRLCNQLTKRYELANCSYSPSPHNAGNGNSRKFPANPTTEQ